jgi:1-deoxy-D-xylulose-5-phosphate synthase
MYLERVDSPEDLKRLSQEALPRLADEIREIIIKQVSLNGGHLASNLGVVELTLALHYVFDSPGDKLVWDVGHQSYTHKIITGRKNLFHTIRRPGGISGFPKPEESPHDAFVAGHSSTSISAALGLLEAGTRLRENFKAVAIIGDGSLTAGLAFEGLNYAGQAGARQMTKDLIVVLNDNEMSISKNVGALSSYLARILRTEFYQKFKDKTKGMLESIPRLGAPVSKLAQKTEEALMGICLPGLLFEELGFHYIGPIDGHDVKALIAVFRKTRETKGPVLVHVVTKKGLGYEYSEKDPCVFHGIGPFDPDSGEPISKSRSMSEVFGDALVKLAETEPRLAAITAAMKEGTGLAGFAQRFPERFYDVGIAEPHAATFAAGLAKGGLKPVVAVYSTFLQRAYDQIIHDVCLQNLPVVFAIDRAGVVGEDGPTHHGMFDLSYLRHIPNLCVMAPKDAPELEKMLEFALRMDSPVAVRYPRGKAIKVSVNEDAPIELARAELLREGREIAILAIGNRVQPALHAAQMLEADGISAMLYNMRFIKPIDTEAIRKAACTGRIITVEDGGLLGGFGSAVCESLFELGLSDVRLSTLGFPDSFIEHGSQKELREKYGLDKNGIYREAKRLLAPIAQVKVMRPTAQPPKPPQSPKSVEERKKAQEA